jgi:murein DD-endopeptidase MepM/ murein hydrolase activator NlpD
MLGALCAAAPAQALDLEVYTRANGKARAIVAKNPHPAPVHLRIEITETENVAGVPAALEVVVPPRRELALATASPVRGDRPMSFSFRRIYSLGDPAARHDDRALYRLPFENGRTFRITQAPGGYSTTHDSPDTRHAVDIAMPVGTRVVAARGGVVVENVRDFHEGGPDVAFLKQANLVRILHDDGTWGEYAHLLRRSSPLVPGQRIETGDFVGLSGNSGYTSGPHLHFVVKRNGGDDDVSVPIRFYTAALGRLELREGMEIAAAYDSRRIVARPAAGAPDAVGASGAAESSHPR